MSLENLGNLGEFIGAIAVLVSVMYLALQIRQNTKSLITQTGQAIMSQAEEWYNSTHWPNNIRGQAAFVVASGHAANADMGNACTWVDHALELIPDFLSFSTQRQQWECSS